MGSCGGTGLLGILLCHDVIGRDAEVNTVSLNVGDRDGWEGALKVGGRQERRNRKQGIESKMERKELGG